MMGLIDWVNKTIGKHYGVFGDAKGLYVVGTCANCSHDGGCDVQEWNNSRADVAPDDPFSCYYWEAKP